MIYFLVTVYISNETVTDECVKSLHVSLVYKIQAHF
jgi:hypothetical protein